MGTLIRFEIKKIVQNRAGVAACAIALILVMALSLGSVLTAGAWDARSGSYVEGLGAWDAIRRTEQSHAGTLDDARVAEDMATYEEAQAPGPMGAGRRPPRQPVRSADDRPVRHRVLARGRPRAL